MELSAEQKAAGGGPWVPIVVPDGGAVTRTFGPLLLTVHRSGRQWWIEQAREGRVAPIGPRPEEDDDEVRFVGEDEADSALVPSAVLADRAIVARPDQPLTVVGRSDAELVVSTPVWLALSTKTGRKVAEIPTVILKESWFGPDTRNGQLCYAARTAARLASEDIDVSPFRAYTIIRIENRSPEPFAVRRVRLPTPYLSLHRAADGRLFTPAVKVVRTGDTEGAESASIEAIRDRKAEVVAQPRTPSDKGLLRSLGRMLG